MGRVDDATAAAKDRLERLEQGKRTGPLVAIARRFGEVAGMDQSGLLAVELFTTIVPLMVIGYAVANRFSADLNPGNLVIRNMNLSGSSAETVRHTFSSARDLSKVWSVTGLASFLFWGIPMSLTVSRLFNLAWRREPFEIGWRILRGFGWFLFYLVTIAASLKISAYGEDAMTRSGLFIVSAAPYAVFWAVTPLILVRDGGKGWPYLWRVGLMGAVVDSIALRLTARIVFPWLLAGWDGFGPIGVALTIMTWCGIIGTGWVITACATAVLWERAAPVDTVLAAQSAE